MQNHPNPTGVIGKLEHNLQAELNDSGTVARAEYQLERFDSALQGFGPSAKPILVQGNFSEVVPLLGRGSIRSLALRAGQTIDVQSTF